MTSNFRRFPNIIHGLLALGGPRLRELADRAGISLKGLPPSPGAIAGALRDRLASPLDLRAYLSPTDLEAIGRRFGMGARTEWEGQAPGFDEAVLARLLEQAQLPQAPASVQSRRDVAAAEQWHELGSLQTWLALEREVQDHLVRELAEVLGPGVQPLEPTGPHHLPCLLDEATGLRFVAIPGGEFTMGLSKTEEQALKRLVKGWSEEAKMHVQDLASVARPAHQVTLPAFLCAAAPLTNEQAQHFRTASTKAAQEYALFEAQVAAPLVVKAGARLLTEAEWEYIARAGGARSWLAGEPGQSAGEFDPLAQDEQPFGIHGLGWGSWVEDGWHTSYQGAPADGSAWEPRQLPETARGGAWLSWPWQVDGEALLLHTAQRERARDQAFPLLLARDLPGRGAHVR